MTIMAFHLKEKPRECDFCQNGFSENKKAKLILMSLLFQVDCGDVLLETTFL